MTEREMRKGVTNDGILWLYNRFDVNLIHWLVWE